MAEAKINIQYDTNGIITGAFDESIQVSGNVIFILKSYWDQYAKYDHSQLTIDANGTITVSSSELLKEATKSWKKDRQAAVDAIVVTYNNVVYQGDELSQSRMARAITALPDDTTTVSWTAKDNTDQSLTRVDLRAILLDAGTQQTNIWSQGRPS